MLMLHNPPNVVFALSETSLSVCKGHALNWFFSVKLVKNTDHRHPKTQDIVQTSPLVTFFYCTILVAYSYLPSCVVAANASREPRNISTMTMSYPIAQTLLAMAAIFGMQWFRRIESIEYAMAKGALSAFSHNLIVGLVL